MPNGTTNPFLEAAKEAFRRTKQDFVEDVLGTADRPGGQPAPDIVAVGKEGGTSLADLMYAFARGRKDEFLEKVGEKFRASGTGQELEQEIRTQAVQDVVGSPAFIITGLIIAVGIVLLAGVFVGRR